MRGVITRCRTASRNVKVQSCLVASQENDAAYTQASGLFLACSEMLHLSEATVVKTPANGSKHQHRENCVPQQVWAKCAEAAGVLRLTHFPPAISCLSSMRKGKFPLLFPWQLPENVEWTLLYVHISASRICLQKPQMKCSFLLLLVEGLCEAKSLKSNEGVAPNGFEKKKSNKSILCDLRSHRGPCCPSLWLRFGCSWGHTLYSSCLWRAVIGFLTMSGKDGGS